MTISKSVVIFAVTLLSAQAASIAAQSRTTRNIVVPESSIAKPSDAGLRAHTNYILSVGGESAAPSAILETPASISCIYQLVAQVSGCPISSTTLTPSGGVGAIAIVDAYDDPNAASDLAVFSTEFKLPKANFSVVYASGSKPVQDPTGSWEFEESLDIEWAHALAPTAVIYLVEAASNSNADLFSAVSVATTLVSAAGGGEISMSWAGPEFSGETSYDKYFTASGILYVAAAGDTAFAKEYPAMSPNVVAAGGTSIQRNSSGVFTGEQYWDDTYGGGGGGISSYETIPSYQSGIKSIVGTHRGAPDISALAEAVYDGAVTGVAIYDSIPYSGAPFYGAAPDWSGALGTSVATPVLAARLNTTAFYSNSPNLLTSMYGEYSSSSLYARYFRDITLGNSNCHTGWDICTGIGAPLGNNIATVSPASVNFGSFSGLLICSETISKTVTLTNNSPVSMSITNVNFSGPSSAFSDSNGCGATLAANASCNITVRFDGGSSVQGSNTDTLNISTSTWNSPAAVSLSATVNENCNGH